MKRTLRLFMPLVSCVLLLLAACGSPATQSQSPAAGATTPAAPPAATPATQTGAAAAYPSQLVNIMAPAAPGGGWDQTARAMQTALGNTSGQQAQVYNVPGAGGTVGLAQLV
nr:hypothetical protein [Chloroflexaceae bacterium]